MFNYLGNGYMDLDSSFFLKLFFMCIKKRTVFIVSLSSNTLLDINLGALIKINKDID